VRALAPLPIEIAIEHAGGVDSDVTQGFGLLARSKPLWPVDDPTWRGVIGTVSDFAAR